jgi:hypothetical protein
MDYQKLKEASEKFTFDKRNLFCQYQVAMMYEKILKKAFEYYAKAANL